MKIPIRYLTVIVISILTIEFALGATIGNKHKDIAGDRDIAGEEFLLDVWGSFAGEYDEQLFWRLKGRESSFKEKEMVVDNPLKIFCLTDSVSVMHRDNYPAILQEYLDGAAPTKNPVVFNVGVPGYTSFQGLKYFESDLLDYDPDIISVCYGWNDHSAASNNLPDKLQQPSKAVFFRTLMNKSNILRVVYQKALSLKQRTYERFDPEKYPRVQIADYHDNIKKFVSICKSKRIKIILMTAPYLDRGRDWVPTHIEYNNVIRKIAKEERVPIIDLVEIFKNREELFMRPNEDHIHYNAAGSKIIATALSDTILGAERPEYPVQGRGQVAEVGAKTSFRNLKTMME